MKKLLVVFMIAFTGTFLSAQTISQNCYWANSGGANQNDYGQSIATDASGNQYVTGSFSSPTITFGSFTLTNSNIGTPDFFLVKYDSGHNVVWAKRAGGTASATDDIGYGVATDASGNVFVTGAFFGDSIKFSSSVYLVNNNLGNADFFLAKYDSNGNPVWATRASGGSSDEIGQSVSTDGSGNIYVTGYFYSPAMTFGSTTITNSGSGIDLFFAKFNSSGVPQWAHSAGGSGAPDYGRSISADNAGNVWITGNFFAPTIIFGSTTLTNNGDDDIFIAHYNTSGVAQWAKSAGGADNDRAYGVITDGSGNAYITGGFQSSTLSFGTNSIGNSNNYYGFYLTKYNSTGNDVWVRGYAGPNDNNAYAITMDGSGNILVTGAFRTASIIFGNDTLINSFPGTPNLFIAKYNSSGTAQWSGNPIGSSWGYGIAADNNANVYVTGTFMGNALFGSTTITSGGGYDYMVADVYPFSPTISSTTSVSCNGGANGTATEINIGGNSPFTYSWSNAQTTSTATNLSAGNYTVTVTDANNCVQSAVATITEPAVLSLSMTQQNIDCSAGVYGEASVTQNGGTSPYTYLWSTSQTTATITNLPEATYSVVVTDANGCTQADSVTLFTSPVTVPPICLVTVDTASQYNVIVWDKTPFTDVDSFIIYREINTNDYQPIGAVPYDSLSQFIDTVRTLYFPNTGDPNAGTYRYKIQSRDSCGGYSLLSPYHNTIFISNNSGTFTWSQLYTIEGSGNPVLNYVLLRDNISNGNWLPVASVAGTQQTISDPAYATYASTGAWRVQTFWNISCTPTMRTSSSPFELQSLNASFSNIQTNVVMTSITDNSASSSSSITISPNPNNGTFSVNVKVVSPSMTVEIYNAIGELILKENIVSENTSIDISNEAKGIYFYKVISKDGMISCGKVVSE